MLFTAFDHRHRGNAGIRERLPQLFALMKLDIAAEYEEYSTLRMHFRPSFVASIQRSFVVL